MSERELPKPWGDDVALLGPEAPRWNGNLWGLLEYLLTVYKRFGDTAITTDLRLQWGSVALHKRDEQRRRIEELENALALGTAEVALQTFDLGPNARSYKGEELPHHVVNAGYAERIAGLLAMERSYIKKMDAVIDDAGVARSCINPLEDLKRAVKALVLRAERAEKETALAKENYRNRPANCAAKTGQAYCTYPTCSCAAPPAR